MQITDESRIIKAIGADLREWRTAAKVTLDVLAALVGEQKASVSKYESGTNQITLQKYLGMIHYLRDSCPDHPAHVLIEAITPMALGTSFSSERPSVRTAGFLDMVDLTRKVCPNHPALPLANHFLYERG
jgi:Helix-turn-helix